MFPEDFSPEIDDDQDEEEVTWTHWVSAEPFRAWLGHLTAATGMEPLTIGVAAGIPTGVARSLITSNARPRRIRAVDAVGLLSLNPNTLASYGQMLCDARPAHLSLLELRSHCPSAEALARRLNIGLDVAEGLIDGWLDVCQQSTAWGCIALASQITYDRAKAGAICIDADDSDVEWDLFELAEAA
ncbi:MAG: hypothetical protein FWD63_05700 [Propionibacteriaceae bacterium]|nr:hypothetical protein [Propionibacteriaceae bacterium]